eukprot:SAG31_NODE_2259_length_6068_cov_10.272240_5_plen_182_part_00
MVSPVAVADRRWHDLVVDHYFAQLGNQADAEYFVASGGHGRPTVVWGRSSAGRFASTRPKPHPSPAVGKTLPSCESGQCPLHFTAIDFAVYVHDRRRLPGYKLATPVASYYSKTLLGVGALQALSYSYTYGWEVESRERLLFHYFVTHLENEATMGKCKRRQEIQCFSCKNSLVESTHLWA